MLPSILEIINNRQVEHNHALILTNYVQNQRWEDATPALITYLKNMEVIERNTNYKAKLKLVISSLQDYFIRKSQEHQTLNEKDVEYAGFVDLKPVLETEDLYY